ncbi:MAG: acetyl-CoA carboxylase biotin carboxyl carrier protein [Sphingomonas sp.]
MSEESEMGAMRIDIDLVRQLAAVLDETQLTEVEVQDGERRVRVARAVTVSAAAPVTHAAPAAPVAAAAPVEAAPPAANAVKSPMVGTAYLSAEPGAKPFVAIGQKIAAGETLLIIEAMKVMNPIHAPSAGIVSQILIEDGQPVEYDQPLIVVE